MSGEKKLFVFLCLLAIVGVTVIYGLLFYSLWQYRTWVGLSLLVVMFVLVVVFVRGRLIEQHLRQIRYHHYEETPLDVCGEPRYWQEGMQENPYRVQSQSYAPSQMQQTYQGYGQEWE
jgi:hypothetical protein